MVSIIPMAYEDIPRRDRFALRVSYRGGPNDILDAKLVTLSHGVLCCAQEGQGTRWLVFEYTEHYLGAEDMSRMADLPNVLTLVLFPRGFACDRCRCLGILAMKLPGY
jgi:hypothetical protein